MMKFVKVLVAILLSLAFAAFSACGSVSTGGGSESAKAEGIIVISPKNGDKIRLANAEITEFTKDYHFGLSVEFIDKTKGDRYFPESVSVEWEEDGVSSGGSELVYAVEISLNENMSDKTTFYATENKLNIENLQSGKRYYIRIRNEENGKTSDVKSFDTEKLPRTVKIEGVSNTRDVGGYAVGTDGDKTVKQGMIYRGAAPDEATERGKKTFGELGIKTIVDLREEFARKRAVSGVYYAELPVNGAPCYASGEKSFIKPEYTDALVRSVRIFADENNYPVYFHCQIGRDRTGTLAFILNGLLGVSYNDLCLDYELSCFSEAGCRDYADGEKQVTNMTSMFNAMYSYFMKYSRAKGDERGDLQSGIAWFLKDNGITEEEISNIKRIMTE